MGTCKLSGNENPSGHSRTSCDARAVIEELAEDRTVEPIWLIGSRANSRAKTTSDWDFLVFSSVEPVHVAERREGIDLLRVRPSGQGHADGGNEFDFLEFQWKVIDDQCASYVGKNFILL
ncbi:MAG: nucleotidyltransferase domain-containing protein [Pyrinomonadaceae bacterium]